MNSHPKLIRSRGFTIESVTHQKDVEGSFRVSLQLSKRERRHVVADAETLFDFGKFRTAALQQANVFLRHDAETQMTEGQRDWIDMIDKAISRGEDD